MGRLKGVWVMDRGMVSEENLEYMRKKRVVSVSPQRLKVLLHRLGLLLPNRPKIIEIAVPTFAAS